MAASAILVKACRHSRRHSVPAQAAVESSKYFQSITGWQPAAKRVHVRVWQWACDEGAGLVRAAAHRLGVRPRRCTSRRAGRLSHVGAPSPVQLRQTLSVEHLTPVGDRGGRREAQLTCVRVAAHGSG